MTDTTIREAVAEALQKATEMAADAPPGVFLRDWLADAAIAAHITALDEAGFIVVPRQPTAEMLASAIPFPEHLRVTQMDAATAAERMALRQRWLDMIAVAPKAM